jgi:hypothetical protein
LFFCESLLQAHSPSRKRTLLNFLWHCLVGAPQVSHEIQLPNILWKDELEMKCP